MTFQGPHNFMVITLGHSVAGVELSLAGSIEEIWIDYTKPRYEDECGWNLEEFERSPLPKNEIPLTSLRVQTTDPKQMIS